MFKIILIVSFILIPSLQVNANNEDKKPTIFVDFSPQGKPIKVAYKRDNGSTITITITPTASNIDQETRNKIINQVQKKFDNALGKDKIIISQNPNDKENADYKISINGKTPRFPPGFNKVGGLGGSSQSWVFEKLITENSDFKTNDEKVNALTGTIAHELGHQIAKLSHNWDKPSNIMTDGKKVPSSDRAKNNREFKEDDKKLLKENLNKNLTPQKSNLQKNQSSKKIGAVFDIGNFTGNEPSLSVEILFSDNENFEFGYINTFEEFILLSLENKSIDFFTFLETNIFFNFAIRNTIDNNFFDAEKFAKVEFLEPIHPNVFSKVSLDFDINLDFITDVNILFDTTFSNCFDCSVLENGGLVAQTNIKEPSSNITLIIFGILSLGLIIRKTTMT